MAAMDKVAKEREEAANKEGKKRSAEGGVVNSKPTPKKKIKMPGVGRRLNDGEDDESVQVAPSNPPAPRAWQFGEIPASSWEFWQRAGREFLPPHGCPWSSGCHCGAPRVTIAAKAQVPKPPLLLRAAQDEVGKGGSKAKANKKLMGEAQVMVRIPASCSINSTNSKPKKAPPDHQPWAWFCGQSV